MFTKNSEATKRSSPSSSSSSRGLGSIVRRSKCCLLPVRCPWVSLLHAKCRRRGLTLLAHRQRRRPELLSVTEVVSRRLSQHSCVCADILDRVSSTVGWKWCRRFVLFLQLSVASRRLSPSPRVFANRSMFPPAASLFLHTCEGAECSDMRALSLSWR